MGRMTLSQYFAPINTLQVSLPQARITHTHGGMSTLRLVEALSMVTNPQKASF